MDHATGRGGRERARTRGPNALRHPGRPPTRRMACAPPQWLNCTFSRKTSPTADRYRGRCTSRTGTADVAWPQLHATDECRDRAAVADRTMVTGPITRRRTGDARRAPAVFARSVFSPRTSPFVSRGIRHNYGQVATPTAALNGETSMRNGNSGAHRGVIFVVRATSLQGAWEKTPKSTDIQLTERLRAPRAGEAMMAGASHALALHERAGGRQSAEPASGEAEARGQLTAHRRGRRIDMPRLRARRPNDDTPPAHYRDDDGHAIRPRRR